MLSSTVMINLYPELEIGKLRKRRERSEAVMHRLPDGSGFGSAEMGRKGSVV